MNKQIRKCLLDILNTTLQLLKLVIVDTTAARALYIVGQ